ncbi:MAG: 16S rRNA (adenine(1518)-N(6)/adenine(1519)-N(6))-dimethyltransferase RsmA [Thermomicrobia bacterium]|nr:16S rRNA (adenine(1518)-N(6)/adenine(1519)-N(6))-dimethyltransferase RsmA [Thermomicrobia bacterium]MCA1723106.1 16S rRNA (adenine(1518)-N(6)/adenine(1519)-N(6))-dimethyltransferase RsmA [Thermomicrobia bacterium]
MNDETPLPPTKMPTPQRVGDWKAILRTLGVTPSRRMGQNFLVDRDVLAGIVEAAGVQPGETVIEVGPGLGILTAALGEAVGASGRVIAVELDKRLADYLQTAYAGTPQVTIIQQDILRATPGDLVGTAPYVVVANLPYRITSAAFRHFLESPHPPERMTLLVQREVAQRIVAAPPEMSILAIAVQFFALPRIVLSVPPEAFVPRPEVHSVVLTLESVPPPLPPERWRGFFALVQAGFGAKRKQIHNSLVERLRLPRETVSAFLAAAGIDAMRRAQTLTLDEWLAMERAAIQLNISLSSAMGRRVGAGDHEQG